MLTREATDFELSELDKIVYTVKGKRSEQTRNIVAHKDSKGEFHYVICVCDWKLYVTHWKLYVTPV